MRKGEMLSMETKGERMIVKFNIPSRGIIGLRNQLLLQQLVRLLWHTVGYEPYKGEIAGRNKGSNFYGKGKAIPYSIDKLQDRGKFSLNQMLKSTKVR
jgi:GTP-binding protein